MWVDAAEIVKQKPPSEAELRQGMEYLKRGAKARLYADENFPFIATRILRRLGAQVETVQEAGLCGHPDEDHAAYALRDGYVLVTCDRDYLENRRFPLIHCPAIASVSSVCPAFLGLLNPCTRLLERTRDDTPGFPTLLPKRGDRPRVNPGGSGLIHPCGWCAWLAHPLA